MAKIPPPAAAKPKALTAAVKPVADAKKLPAPKAKKPSARSEDDESDGSDDGVEAAVAAGPAVNRTQRARKAPVTYIEIGSDEPESEDDSSEADSDFDGEDEDDWWDGASGSPWVLQEFVLQDESGCAEVSWFEVLLILSNIFDMKGDALIIRLDYFEGEDGVLCFISSVWCQPTLFWNSRRGGDGQQGNNV